MRIGVITTSFPRWPGDYAGSFVEESVRRLLRDGHSVDIVAAGEAGNPPRSVFSLAPLASVDLEDPMAAALGAAVRLARVPIPCARPAIPNLFYEEGAPEVLERGLPSAWLQAAAFCAGLCARVDAWAPEWDEIHAHWLLPCALLARAASLRRLAPGREPLRSPGPDPERDRYPRVGGARRPPPGVHGHAHSGDVALLERMAGGAALARWLGRELGDVTFASADLRRRFLGLVGGTTRARTHVASAVVPRAAVPSPEPGGTASDARADARSPSTDQSGDPRAAAVGPASRGFILAVGRLVPIKGFDLLLRATALAEARSGAKVVVVILGDGPERARLTRSALRLGIDLRLPGFIPRAEVDTWLRAARVYVQPSRALWNGRTEGLPVSTLEALALGIPVIASDSGGLAELAQPDEAGSLIQVFRAGDHRALATRLEGFLDARPQERHPPGARNLAHGEVSAA